MRRDDWKFLTALAATLLLAGWVVFSTWSREQAAAVGPTVDLPRLEQLAGQGAVSLHPADYWEPAPEPP